MFWILVSIVALVLGYLKLIRPFGYWSRQGVVQGKPVFILGDVWPMIFRTQSVPEMNEKLYNIDQNARYCGIYTFLTPHLLLRDPELIKQITVKDFDHFTDHRGFVAEGADPLFDRNLIGLTGEKWREMRATISPSFTSSKMKYLFSLISQGGEQFVNHFLKKKEKVITIEMRDITTKFTNDVIANTIFGFDCDSLENPDNEFYLCGTEVTDFSKPRTIITFMGHMFFPRLFKFFKVPLFATKIIHFFTNVVEENIKSREDSGTTRPDMISLLLETRKNILKHDEPAALPDTGFATVEESEVGKNQKFRKREITNLDITSQAFTFFFAGFDSVSSLICFMSHELAVNQEIQERLRQEVDKVKGKCNGNITYEAIATMKYMDMVVSETLRKYPNAIAADRRCTKPYTIEPKTPDEKPVHLEKDTLIIIPIYGIHRDPQYYPDPERFDPERFSDENKSNIKPYTFMPFGTGPRNCIGSRFALLETKIFFYYLLTNFELIPVEKTQIPIKFSRKAINMSSDKGFWLGLQSRVDPIKL